MKYEMKKIETDKKLTVKDLFPDDNHLRRDTIYLNREGEITTSREEAVKGITIYYDENNRVVKEERFNIEITKTK